MTPPLRIIKLQKRGVLPSRGAEVGKFPKLFANTGCSPICQQIGLGNPLLSTIACDGPELEPHSRDITYTATKIFHKFLQKVP